MGGFIGLRMTLLHGGIFQIRATPEGAANISKAWANDVTGNVKGGVLSGTEPGPGGINWCVKTDCVQAMHTFDLELQPVQQPSTQAGPYSGLVVR